jgi:GTP-binding protein YchF
MSLKIGIVGLPNVGKSTLFNALSGTNQAAASNFPFCTIEPNTGIVPVPDSRLVKLAEIEKSAKLIPPTVEFVDIAGLVAGASSGQGLGNKFLGHIREVDAIIHVVRLFEDKDIIHVSGNISPLDDAKVINLELILSDLEHLEKLEVSTTKAARGGDAEAKATLELIAKFKSHLEQELPARSLVLTDTEKELAAPLQLLTIKPILYVANVAESQLGDAGAIADLKNSLGSHEDVLAISAQIEAEIAVLAPTDQEEYLKSLGLTEPGLNVLIRHGYKLLGLITYFTAGPQEARGWTIRQGTNAQEAAGVIHTDFAKGFIRAETVSYDDFVTLGGWGPARTAGKVRSEGKTYIVSDGDVLLFRFNV